ncbi:EamA family transporter [Pseudomonadota bacterium]
MHSAIFIFNRKPGKIISLEPWIVASLIAMLANVAKVLLVKTRCRHVESWTLLLHARLLPGLVLLGALPFVEHAINDTLAFWGATLAAAVITIGASLLYMEAIKEGDLSQVTPVQATVPMFMIVCTFILYGEVPNTLSFVFIALIAVSVSFVLRTSASDKSKDKNRHPSRALLYSFIAAALFGVSTVLDRVAINAADNGALVFSAYWHLLTLLLLAPLLWFKRQQVSFKAALNGSVMLYVIAVLTAFITQQFAVQLSLELDNGVTFVKTIVMAHIVIASGIGIVYLKERAGSSVWFANIVTAVSGVGLLWSI